MASASFDKVKKKLQKWSKDFPEKEFDFMNEGSYEDIENFLKSKGEKIDFIKVGNASMMLSSWYFADFIEKYLSKKEDHLHSLKQGMLWRSIDLRLYAAGKKGDIQPVWFSELCMSACDMIILEKPEVALRLLAYMAACKINFEAEPADSVIQYTPKLYQLFFKDLATDHAFPEPLNAPYSQLLEHIKSTDNAALDKALEDACEFHLGRVKEYQEFQLEHNMIFPAEILAALFLRNKEGLSLPAHDHPLIATLIPLLPALADVAPDPKYEEVVEKIRSFDKKFI